MDLEQLVENGAQVVDVRTPAEFMGGSVANSVNIPLNEIPNRLTEIKALNGPLILCCASGGRSAQACQYLSNEGINCYNAGSWFDVNFFVSNSTL